MSWSPCPDPTLGVPTTVDAIEKLIIPRAVDLGGMEVRRALPSTKRQMVGPFIFFDQMGPAEFLTDQGIDVRPHPHINLATVTYLFEGGLRHRDSLGTDREIEPGAVNWMKAGRGIVHSERTDEAPDDADAEMPIEMDRVEVYQAAGMLIPALGVGADEAMLRLRAHALATGQTASQVARAIIERRLVLERDDPAPEGSHP